jgi:subtilisin family serine protease
MALMPAKSLSPASALHSVETALFASLHLDPLDTACAPQWSFVAARLRLSVCHRDLGAAVRALAALPSVTWVEQVLPPKPQNLIAGADVQSMGPLLVSNLTNGAPREFAAAWMPFWRAGLDGKGQVSCGSVNLICSSPQYYLSIVCYRALANAQRQCGQLIPRLTRFPQVVGISDSGIDMDSCFMYDPAFSDYRNGNSTTRTPVNVFLARNAALVNFTNEPGSRTFGPFTKVSSLQNVSVFRNDAHRKVVMYAFWADQTDLSGHGTHTTGTVAGSAYGIDYRTAPLLGTGIAPGAKVM